MSYKTEPRPSTSRNTEAAQIDFNDVFSLRKPKDAKAGLASGVKSVAKGFLAGALGLVACPVIGACQDGFKGAAYGLGAGVVGAVVLPVTGTVVGAAQVVRGVINTPEAVAESSKGRVWNQDLREWAEKDCLALPEAIAKQERRWGTSNRNWDGREPSSEDYYALLEVPRNATDNEIKKKYYVLARRWHPDKCQDDPEANERFQKLGEAYQVLSNPQMRERYDKDGEDGIDNSNLLDSALFFGMLFGSEKFEYLVGELMISTAARLGGSLIPAEMQKAQVQREVTLAVNLSALLRRYVEGDHTGFEESMRAEAADLVSASFGDRLLHTIGNVYKMQAEIFLGSVWSSTVSVLALQFHSMSSQLDAANAAIKAYKAHLEIESNVRKATLPPEGEDGPSSTESDAQRTIRTGLEEKALPLMLDAMWAANVVDIESTLKRVCKRALQEESVGKEVLLERARALQELGKIFMATNAPEGKSAKDTMETAMRGAMQRQSGMEPSPEDAAE